MFSFRILFIILVRIKRIAHRYAFDDESERDLPEQIGTEQWTQSFSQRYLNIPEA